MERKALDRGRGLGEGLHHWDAPNFVFFLITFDRENLDGAVILAIQLA
jgi:hypothetical protein